ncbi:MAG: aldo/keto reductase [Planctomycetaceae bacterium]|jgi:predicted aldo/keto reductase-like oxidoreductase|nr:aldo/keto reductase [Planctomycetaceae bacterium]
MIYRTYGKTGKKVSLMGVGTSRFDPNNSLFSKNVDLVLQAIELGINYFDTAPTYASGASEKILGTAFAQTKKEIFTVTKSMLSMEPTADDVLRRIEMSLKTLNVSRITFFHLWSLLNIQQYRQIIVPDGPFEGALKAKDRGLVEHICFSAHCSGDEVTEILHDGLFDGVTLGFNALNFHYRIDGLNKAYEMGLGVAVMNPLGGGLIPKNPDYFQFLQEERYSIVDSALRFVASHKEVSTVLVGINNERDLLEGVQAFSEKNLLSEKKLEVLYSSVTNSLDNCLCTACGYCYGCPAGLPVSKLMSLYNEYILSNENIEHYHSRSYDWYRISPLDTFSCIQCGKCEKKCTQHLPIIKRIAEMNEFSNQEIRKWQEIADRVFPKNGEMIGIYGISFDAEHLLRSYTMIHGKIDFPIAFFDSNNAKWGKRFMDTDYIIQPPEAILKNNIRYIVVTAKKYYTQIKDFLQNYVTDDTEIISI